MKIIPNSVPARLILNPGSPGYPIVAWDFSNPEEDFGHPIILTSSGAIRADWWPTVKQAENWRIIPEGGE